MLACEHFREREGHSSASAELGMRSNDFSSYTKDSSIVLWELWLIKAAFPVSSLHAGLPSKVALPSRLLCGLPHQTMNNESLVTNFHKVWPYTIVLKAWKKAQSPVQLSTQRTYSDTEAVMALMELNWCIFRPDPSILIAPVFGFHCKKWASNLLSINYLQNFRKACELPAQIKHQPRFHRQLPLHTSVVIMAQIAPQAFGISLCVKSFFKTLAYYLNFTDLTKQNLPL